MIHLVYYRLLTLQVIVKFVFKIVWAYVGFQHPLDTLFIQKNKTKKKFKLSKSFTLSTGRVETYAPHRSSGVFVCPVGLNIIDFVSPGCVCVVFEEGAGTQPWIARSYFCNGYGDLESTPVSSCLTFTFFLSSHIKPPEILCFLLAKVCNSFILVITDDFKYLQNLHLAALIDFSTILHTH